MAISFTKSVTICYQLYVIHKLPSIKPYNHPRCNWRVSFTSLVGNKVKRLSKTFKEHSDAKNFHDLKMKHYKVHNFMAVNEMSALLPAIIEWTKFCEKNPVVKVDELLNVVQSSVANITQSLKSQELEIIINSFLEEKIKQFQKKTHKNTDIGSNCRNLKNRLKKLIEHFGSKTLISSISLSDAKYFLEWLSEEYEYEAQTLYNHRSSVVTLFNYSVKHEYVKSNVFKLTDPPNIEDKEIRFYSLEQMENMWWQACPDIKLAIVLQAFCGVRTCEYKRLLWKDIDEKNNVIHIRANVGKKRKKRTITLDDLQSSQLTYLRQQLHTFNYFTEEQSEDHTDSMDELIKSLSLPKEVTEGNDSDKVFTIKEKEYKRRLDELIPVRIPNGFRHAFGTYHYALHNNWMKTTEMMGNSQKVLKKHYSGLSNPKESANFFNIINDINLPTPAIDPLYTDELAPAVEHDDIVDLLKEHSIANHPAQRRIHKNQ